MLAMDPLDVTKKVAEAGDAETVLLYRRALENGTGVPQSSELAA